ITWSDGCIAQNKNSFISIAVADFLKRHPTINDFTMKYSVPGHSCVQEVDNIHSRIEQFLKKMEVWSPKSFIRLLNKIERRKSKQFYIIELAREHFFDYQKAARNFSFNKIPYAKIYQLKFNQKNLFDVQYNLKYDTEGFMKV